MKGIFFTMALLVSSTQAFAWYSESCDVIQQKYGFFTDRPDMMASCKVGETHYSGIKDEFNWNFFGMCECDPETGWALDGCEGGISCLVVDTISKDRFCEWMTRTPRKYQLDGVWINHRYTDFSQLYPTAEKFENHMAKYCSERFGATFEYRVVLD